MCFIIPVCIIISEPAHDKSFNNTEMTSEDSDQTARPRSLIWLSLIAGAFYSLQAIQRNKREPLPYWRMYRLTWIFAGHTGLIVGFIVRWLIYKPGPNCSKLTMSLVNVSLNLWSSNMAYMLIICKSYSHFFSAKTTCELDIVLNRTVSNELVKLTTLQTTGPWLSI